MPTMGEILTAARKARGLSQTQAAAQLAASARSVGGWENDAHAPQTEQWALMVDLYGSATVLQAIRARLTHNHEDAAA